MHIAAGLSDALPVGILQATASSCASFDLEPPSCARFNDQVFSYLKLHPLISTVLLAADYRQRFADREATAAIISARRLYLIKFVRDLQGLGRKVVVVIPPPFVGERNVRCAERRLTSKFVFGENQTCDLAMADYRSQERPALDLIEELRSTLKVQILDLPSASCDEMACHSVLDGVLIYRDDGGHLTYAGSQAIFKKLDASLHEIF